MEFLENPIYQELINHCITTLRADIEIKPTITQEIHIGVVGCYVPFMRLIGGTIISEASMGEGGITIDLHSPDATDKMINLIKMRFFSMAPHIASNIIANYIKEPDPKMPVRTLRLLINRAAINSETSFKFTRSVYHDRPPSNFHNINVRDLVENKVARDPKYALAYAEVILRHRWPQSEAVGQLAEVTISGSPHIAAKYALFTTKRWDTSTTVGKRAEEGIAKQSGAAIDYATLIPINDPYMQEIELAVLIGTPMDAARYAVEVLKKPWPNDDIGQAMEDKISSSTRAISIYKTVKKIKIEKKLSKEQTDAGE